MDCYLKILEMTSMNVLGEDNSERTEYLHMSRVQQDYNNKGNPLIVTSKYSTSKSAIPVPVEFYLVNSIGIDHETNDEYICDSGNDRIQVFNECLQLLFMFNEEMNGPFGTYGIMNKVYMNQCYAHSLNVYSSDSKFLRSVGGRGSGELEFLFPKVYSQDISNRGELIHSFEKEGDQEREFVREFVKPSGIASYSKNRIIVVSNNTSYCIHLF